MALRSALRVCKASAVFYEAQVWDCSGLFGATAFYGTSPRQHLIILVYATLCFSLAGTPKVWKMAGYRCVADLSAGPRSRQRVRECDQTGAPVIDISVDTVPYDCVAGRRISA